MNDDRLIRIVIIFSHLRSLPCCMAVRRQSGAKQQLGNRNHARSYVNMNTNHKTLKDEQFISVTLSSRSACINTVASQHPFPSGKPIVEHNRKRLSLNIVIATTPWAFRSRISGLKPELRSFVEVVERPPLACTGRIVIRAPSRISFGEDYQIRLGISSPRRSPLHHRSADNYRPARTPQAF